MIPIGWSVGDLLTAIHVLNKAIKALDESKGAKSDYQELIKEIFGLEQILIDIKGLSLDDHGMLKQASYDCHLCIDNFLKPFEKYGSLSSGSSSLIDQWRKVKFAVVHEGDVRKFKEVLQNKIAMLSLTLNTIQLSHAVSSNRSRGEQFEKHTKLVTEIRRQLSASDEEQTGLLRRIEGLLLSQQKQLASPSDSDEANPRFVVRPLKLTGAPLAPAFVQRLDVMKAMEEKLLPISKDQQTILVLHGMGGIGKSQMAREYAKKHQDDYTAVFWVNAKSENSLKGDLAGIARRLQLTNVLDDTGRIGKGDNIMDTAISAIQEWFDEDENTDWLIILDNVDSQLGQVDDVDDEQFLENDSTFDASRYMPTTPHGTVLITSRLSYVARELGGISYMVDQMTVQESLDLICELSGLENDSLGAEEMVKKLGCYPLALSQVGRHIRETQTSFPRYLELYDTKFEKVSRQNLSPREYHHRSISAAFRISYETLKAKHAVAAALLGFCGCLDNSGISWDIFNAAFIPDSAPLPFSDRALCDWIPRLSSGWFTTIKADEAQFDEAIELLLRFSFVRRNMESASISIHPVVHKWTLLLYDNETRESLLEMATHMMMCEFIREDPERGLLATRVDYGTLVRFRPHAEQCISLLGHNLNEAKWALPTLIYLGAYFSDQDIFDVAQPLLELGRRRLDEQLDLETETDILRSVKLRVLIAESAAIDDADKQQLENLESAWTALRKYTLPRTQQWSFYDVRVVELLLLHYWAVKQYSKAIMVADQAIEEYKANSLSLSTILHLMFLKGFSLWYSDRIAEALQISQETIAKVEQLLHDTLENGKSLQDHPTLNGLLTENSSLVGRAHFKLGNLKEGRKYLAQAFLSAQHSKFALLALASKFNQTERGTDSLWNPIVQDSRILHPSTLLRVNIVWKYSIRTGPRDNWSEVINAVRTAIRYRPGTWRYKRLVEEYDLKYIR